MKINSPPLELFNLRIQFEDSKYYSFQKLYEFLESVSDLFSNELQFMLPPIQLSNFDLSFKPIQFTSNDKNHQLILFSDGIQFRSTKYTTWDEEKEKYMNIINKFTEIFDHKKIKNIYIEYIDKFLLPKSNFVINQWFNLSPMAPDIWNIKYNDFHLGISFDVPAKQNLILRLKGREPEDMTNYKLLLETVFTHDVNININDNYELLMNKLDEGHNLVNKIFKEVLTKDLKSKLGFLEE